MILRNTLDIIKVCYWYNQYGGYGVFALMNLMKIDVTLEFITWVISTTFIQIPLNLTIVRHLLLYQEPFFSLAIFCLVIPI